MSAVDVLKSVLDEIGIFRANPELATTTDKDIIEIRNFMSQAGQEVARRAEFSKLFTDLIVPDGVSFVDLPVYFSRLPSRGGTVRNQDAPFVPWLPVVDDAIWRLIEVRPSTVNKFYYQNSGRIYFSPTPLDVIVSVRFISRNWVNDAVVGTEIINQNGDTLLVPEKLVQKGTVWRWLRKKGLPYEDHVAEFEADLVTEIKSDRGDI